MRIAFFHNLPSGGGKRSAYEWIKYMTQNHEVDLYLYDLRAEDFLDMRPFVRRTILVSGGKTFGAGAVRRLISLNGVRLASQQIAHQINDGDYDLAFIMQCQVSNSPFVLRHLRIPSLYFCHEPLTKILEPHVDGPWKEGRLATLKRMVINRMIASDRANAVRATLICATSLYSLENIYRAYGVYPRLNYPGVDAQEFHPLNLKRESMILCIGSLIPAKGNDFVIKSVGTLSERERPSVKFIYNYNFSNYRRNYQEELGRLANRLGVSVSFDNLVADDYLVTAYNRATITACPNLLEPLGLVPLESMACGTPVVAIAEGGLRETIKNYETGLFAERDPYEFGQAIHQLLSDKPLCEKMGACGRQHVLEHWTWEKSYHKLEKNMQRTLGRYNSHDNLLDL